MKVKLFFILVSFFLFNCNKEDGSNNSQVELSNRTQSNYEAFETYLNATYASNPEKSEIPQTYEIAITHNNGYIDETEKNRIIGLIASHISDGADPFVIDIDIKNSNVEVISNKEDIIDNPFPDGVRPDGGLTNNGIVAGTWCVGALDLGGGGCGRVAAKYIYTRNLPNLYYWSDIRVFEILGNCSDNIEDGWNDPLERYRVMYDDDFYHYEVGCGNNDPLCLSSSDLQDQFNALTSIVQQNLPSPFQIISIRRAWLDVHPSPPSSYDYYWHYYIKVGIPNSI